MRKSKPGPKSKVTAPLVRRVSKLVAMGIPIRASLALTCELTGEHVTLHAYERHLRRHPKLRAIQGRAKLKFFEKAVVAICSKPSRTLIWYLEHFFPDVFCPLEEDEVYAAEHDPTLESQIIDNPEEAPEEPQ